MTLLAILVAAFILVVFIVCLAVVTGRELRRSREDRESREAYDQTPSWPELLGR